MAGISGIPPTRRPEAREPGDVFLPSDWEGLADRGFYNALLRLLDELGYHGEAWWFLSRPEDEPFRKSGRIYVPPVNSEKIRLTAPQGSSLLVSSIKFDFPEPVGRCCATVTFQHTGLYNRLDTYQTKSANVKDTLLQTRILLLPEKYLELTITNHYKHGRAIADFEILGKLLSGVTQHTKRR